MLDEAAQTHPNSWWWVKADGCDLTCGLGESTRSKWSGDVDLNDGKLQEVFEAYTKRLEFVKQVGMGSPDTAHLLHDIDTCIDQIKEDLDFITASEYA